MLKPIEQHLICTDTTYICREETMKALDFPLFRYYSYLTVNTTEIIQRQRLFECILNSKEVLDILYCFREQIAILANLVKQTGNFDSGETEGLLYSIKELSIFTDTIDMISEKSCKLPKDLSCDRLQGLLSEICGIAADEQYIGIKKWLSLYASSLRNLHSITLGVNLDAQFNAKEVGIVSFNETPYMRTKGMDGLIRTQKASDNFSCLCTLGIKEAGLTERSALAINREFFTAMNQTIKRSARSIKKLLNDSLQKTLLSLIPLKEELNFLINCSNYFQNCIGKQLPLCFPKIGEQTVLNNLYNPLLLSVCSPSEIIPASFIPNNDQQIFILTGPNSGGKTSYIKSLGFAWLSFQLGLPVTAKQAQMKPMNRIITHFVEKERK